MEDLKDIIRRKLADADCELRQREDALMKELIRRALLQNPDLVDEWQEVAARQQAVLKMRRQETINMYQVMEAERIAEHRENRKIKYNDRLNKNKLSALRRSNDYKYGTRLEQIHIEIRDYYEPYNIPVPQGLIDEQNTLLGKTTSMAG